MICHKLALLLLSSQIDSAPPWILSLYISFDPCLEISLALYNLSSCLTGVGCYVGVVFLAGLKVPVF